jgi:pimeloyl-ACP methyl ester carboxylesterase
LCAPLRSWDKVASCLNRDGFGVLRYDQPGHDASDAPTDSSTTSFESLASDVKELLETLKIDCLYACIGVSMGAATGIYFVTAFPGVVEKLIICDTITCSAAVAGVQDVFAPRVEAARNAGNLDAIVEQTIERWFSSAWRSANYSEVQRMRSIMKDTRVDGFTACCNALQSESFDLRPLVARLGDSVKGVLFGVGELDANLPQTMEMLRAETQKSFDRAGSKAEIQLRKIKGAGHVCMLHRWVGWFLRHGHRISVADAVEQS